MKSSHHRVPGLHRLKSNITLRPPNLSHQYLVRSLPQRRPQQVEHGYRPTGILHLRRLHHLPYPVLMRHLQLRGILYADYLRQRMDKSSDRVKHRRLTRSCLPGNKDIHPVTNNQRQVGKHLIANRPEINQFKDRYRFFAEFTNAEIRAPLGDISAIDDIDARTVRQGGIGNRVFIGNRLLHLLCQPGYEFVKLIISRKRNRALQALEDFMFNKYMPQPGTAYVLDVGVDY